MRKKESLLAGKHLLVVDDEVDVLEVLEEALSMCHVSWRTYWRPSNWASISGGDGMTGWALFSKGGSGLIGKKTITSSGPNFVGLTNCMLIVLHPAMTEEG